MKFMKVIISKVDLDTCLTAYLLNVRKDYNVIEFHHQAPKQYILDPKVLCIESGGTGLVELNNFDHHDPQTYVPPACKQAFELTGHKDNNLATLVNYVSLVDEGKPIIPHPDFPSLSNIFSGMVMVEKSPIEQLFKGMDILNTVLKMGYSPFEPLPILPEWKHFIQKKEENYLTLLRDLKNLKVFYSKKGLKIGYLKTTSIGGLGYIYNIGCVAGVLYNPRFGNPPFPKYTIASSQLDISQLLRVLLKLETGWGGRHNIIGSPRKGSALSVEQVLKIVKEYL